MTTLDKGIREENLHALSRRWKLAQAGTMDDPKIMQRWFPEPVRNFVCEA